MDPSVRDGLTSHWIRSLYEDTERPSERLDRRDVKVGLGGKGFVGPAARY